MMQKSAEIAKSLHFFVCDYIRSITTRSGMQQDERASARKLRPTAL